MVNFEENKLICMIREYVKTGTEFPGASSVLSKIQEKYNENVRIFGEKYSDEKLDTFLQELNNEELERLYIDNEKNINDCHHIISISFEDALDKRMDSLNKKDECFSIKCDGFYFSIKYIKENLYEFSIIKTKETVIIDELEKERVISCLLAKDILRENEKEEFRQEFIRARLLEKQLQNAASKSGGASVAVALGKKDIPTELKRIQAAREVEDVSFILKQNIPLEKKVVKTLDYRKAFVLTNNYYTDRRRMIIFAKVGDEFYIKTFTPSDVRTGLEDIPDVSLNEENCTHIRKGVDEYKLPAGKGYLVVETRTVEAEGIKIILSGLTEREWSCHISDSLEIAPPSQKEYFTDRCNEDHNCLLYYLYAIGMARGTEFLEFLQRVVVSDLNYEAKLTGKKRASYIFDGKGKDGSINKFLVWFEQNMEKKEFIDMHVDIVIRNREGKTVSIRAGHIREALVFDSKSLKVNSKTKQDDFITMVLMHMHREQCHFRELIKLMANCCFVIDPNQKIRILTNTEIFQAVMNDYRKLYQKYMHCHEEFDAFEDEFNKCKDHDMLRLDGEKYRWISRELRDSVAEEFREILTNSKEFDALQATTMESKIYTEKIIELHYFINMHKIIASMNSNVETLEGLCDLGIKYSRTVAGLEGIDYKI